MKKHIHILHYLVLALVLSSGLMMLFLYQGHPQLQFYLGVGMSVSYFSWGIVHHLLLGDLHVKHVVEYGLIAVFGVVLLMMVLL